MNIADGADVYGYTIFCDDIRLEASGKITYVGAYPQGLMTVHGQFPLVLPRFGIHFFYFQKRPYVIPPTRIIIATPGNTEDNPAIFLDVPQDGMHEALAQFDSTHSGDDIENNRYFLCSSPATFTNFIITEPGDIRVRAVRGDQFIRLGRLRVIIDSNYKPPAETKEAAS